MSFPLYCYAGPPYSLQQSSSTRGKNYPKEISYFFAPNGKGNVIGHS